MGLRRKILLGVLLLYILLVGLVQIYFGNAIRSVLVRNADSYNANSFEQTRRSIEQLIEQVNNAANLICFNEKIAGKINRLDTVDSWTRYEDVTFINQELRSARNILLSGYAVDLYLICAGGMISNSNYQSMEAVDYAEIVESSWYDSNELVYGRGHWLTPTDAYFASSNQESFFTLVQNIWGETTYSGYRGVLILNIREKDSFRSLLEAARMSGEVDFYLVDGNRQVVSSTNSKAYSARLSDLAFGPELETRLGDGIYGAYQRTGDQGDVHVNYAALSGTDWLIVQTMPYGNLINETDEIQRRFFYIITLIVALVMAGTMIFSVRLLKPIINMADAAREISRGQFTRRLHIQRDDEIGQLSNAFDKMCDDIEELMQKLRQENELRNRLNLEMLKSQLEPHFLFNALNSIKSVANVSGNTTIAQMVTNLAYILESALGKNEEFISLRDELAFTDHYVALQRIRFNDFEYALEVEDVVLDCIVPRMILQPLIENSIKHGFFNNPVRGTIHLAARRQDDALIIELEDNGVGMDVEKIEAIIRGQADSAQQYVGLRNIYQRLMIYYGRIERPDGKRFGMTIYSQPGCSTSVCLCIPYTSGRKKDD